MTLWMLTLQRLGGGKSLTCIIKDVLTYHRDLLPDNKRVREGTLSERSGSHMVPLGSDYRIATSVRVFAERVSDSLDRTVPSLGLRTNARSSSTALR